MISPWQLKIKERGIGEKSVKLDVILGTLHFNGWHSEHGHIRETLLYKSYLTNQMGLIETAPVVRYMMSHQTNVDQVTNDMIL